MLKGKNEGHFTQYTPPADSVMSFYANLQVNNLLGVSADALLFCS